MGDVLTNDVTYRRAVETTPGAVPTASNTVWRDLEPNGIDTSGVTITTVAREPLGSGGQLSKGVVTGQTSGFSYNGDITWNAMRLLAEAFSYANSTRADTTWEGGIGVSSSQNRYTVSAIEASARSKLVYASSGPKTLFMARGFTNEGNNGLAVLAAAASSGNNVQVSKTLVTETGGNESTLEVCGVRGGSGNFALTVASNGRTATLVSSASGFDWTRLGLTAGQYIHIGGEATANRLDAGSGKARVLMIQAASLTLDRLSPSLATDDGSGKELDVLWGPYYRNVSREHADYNRRSYTTETRMPGYGPANETYNEYSVGNIANELTITVAAQDKVTASYTFVGTDTLDAVPDSGRAANAANSIKPIGTTALSSTVDLGRVRVFNEDDSGETTDFRECSFTINRNVTPSNILGQLAARRINNGNINATMSGTAIFTSGAVTNAIKNNLTSSFGIELENEDGGVLIELPSMTLSDGSRTFTNNEEVTIAISGSAFGDAVFDTSFSFSLFPYLPT